MKTEGEGGLEGDFGCVGEATVGHGRGEGVIARLDGELGFTGEGVGELRQEANAEGVGGEGGFSLGQGRGVVAFFDLPDVVGFPGEGVVGLVGVVEPGAIFVLVVAGGVVIVGLGVFALGVVGLPGGGEPIFAGLVDGEGIEGALVGEVEGEAGGIEAGGARAIATVTIADDALGTEGHILAADLDIYEVKEAGILEVEVVDEEDVGEALLTLVRLAGVVVAELIGHAQEELEVAGGGLAPEASADAGVVGVALLGVLLGGEVVGGIIAEAEVATEVPGKRLWGVALGRKERQARQEGDGEECGTFHCLLLFW